MHARARRDASTSFLRLLSMPSTLAPGRPRGRPPADADASGRERHILAATMRLFLGWSVPRVAERLDVSHRTVHYWTDRALGYDDPRAEALRHLAGRA